MAVSIITGQPIAVGETIVSAYRTKYSIRVFFESHEGLREIKQRVDCFIGDDFIEKKLAEKNPNHGATKNRKYFSDLRNRAISTRTNILPSQQAEDFLQSLIATNARLFHRQWAFVAREFKKIATIEQIQDNDFDETSHLLRIP